MAFKNLVQKFFSGESDANAGNVAAYVCVALLAFVAMSPVINAGFVNWDDAGYILNNLHIRSLSVHNIAGIFSGLEQQLYTPLTTLSFALDYHLFGLNPTWYHSVNLLFHIANSLLVLRLLTLLSGSMPISVAAAALFAVHPMHVESVAFLAERKDMLYSFFYLASILLYLAWHGKGKAWRFWTAVSLFALAILAKPMAVTLPFALLVVDRLQGRKLTAQSLYEKIPFFVLSAWSATALLLQPKTHLVLAGVLVRVAAPIYNLLFYIGKLAFPAGLCAAYNAPSFSVGAVCAYVAVFCAVVFAVWRFFRDDVEVTSWLMFYVITLLPVLQIEIFGPVIAADRYSYISSIGLFMAALCAARALAGKLKYQPQQVRAFGVAFLCAFTAIFIVTARARAAVWRDGITLWNDTIAKQPSAMAFSALGNSWLEKGKAEIAEKCFGDALKIEPRHEIALIGFGNCRAAIGDLDGALAGYRAALAVAPNNPSLRANIANVYFLKGDAKSAIVEMDAALGLAPDSPLFLNAMAGYYTSEKDYKNASQALERSYALAPDDATAAKLCMLCRILPDGGFCSRCGDLSPLKTETVQPQQKTESPAAPVHKKKAEKKHKEKAKRHTAKHL